MKPTKTDWAYLAGLIDGEGCLTIDSGTYGHSANPTYTLRLIISMTDLDVGNWLVKKFGGAMWHHDARVGGRKRYFIWKVTNWKVRRVLDNTYKFLIVKKKRAQIAYRWLGLKRFTRKNYKSGRFSPMPVRTLNARAKCKREIAALNKQKVVLKAVA